MAPGQDVHRIFRAINQRSAVGQERASKWLVALLAGVDARLATGQHGLRIANPVHDLRQPLSDRLIDARLDKQATILALPRVDEAAINVGNRRSRHRNTGRLRNPGLNCRIVQMVVLHAGRGFHFEQVIAIRARGQHVDAYQHIVGFKGGFENRAIRYVDERFAR